MSLMSFRNHVGDEDESFIPEEVTDHNTWNEAEVVQSGPLQIHAEQLGLVHLVDTPPWLNYRWLRVQGIAGANSVHSF